LYEHIFLENEKEIGRDRERGGLGGFCFWFLFFFIFINIGGTLTSPIGEASIKKKK